MKQQKACAKILDLLKYWTHRDTRMLFLKFKRKKQQNRLHLPVMEAEIQHDQVISFCLNPPFGSLRIYMVMKGEKVEYKALEFED